MLKTGNAFQSQTYQNWRLVLPAKEIETTPLITDKRIVVMEAKSNKVHNIEKAVAKYCQPKGYAVILNAGETFNSDSALE